MGLPPGGDMFIHGTPWWAIILTDWTAGCIAVSNDDMDVIWAAVPDGTPIEIRP